MVEPRNEEARVKPLRYCLLLLAAAGLLLTACHKDAKSKWTILAYYDGNNNIDEMANGTSAGIAEAQELEKIGSTDKIQVFAMIGAKKTGGGCKYYHVEKFDNELPDQYSSTMIENLGAKDMSDKQTLYNFIVEGRKRYPAENYVLLLFDHGGGWRGLLWDEVNGAGAGMSMPELTQGLDTFHFEIIKFDMCLMSMIEVAYEVKDHADYMFGCQFVSRPHSFGSAEWLGALSADPNMATVDLGKKMVEAANNANIANQYVGHASLTDLSKLAPIVSQLGDLGTDLVAQGGTYGAEIVDALGKSHNTDLDGTYFIDLREFCKNVLQEPNLKNVNRIANECNGIVSGLNDAVVMTMTANTTIPRGGLCIHFPWRADMFDSADYVKLQFQATNWYAFLSQLIGMLGGGGGGNGSIHIVSTPPGAEIWVDGNDLGGVTPATIQDVPEGSHPVKLTLNGYQDWTGNVDVVANQTAEVNATLVQGGGQTLTVSGTVTWPGHSLSNYCIAFLDTSTTSQIYAIGIAQVNPGNGAYSIQLDLSASLTAYVEAFDDVNNNSSIDAGEGFHWWDQNGNNQWDDMLTFQPGQTVTNANIVLETVTGTEGLFKRRFAGH
jgi:hypothetical protein